MDGRGTPTSYLHNPPHSPLWEPHLDGTEGEIQGEVPQSLLVEQYSPTINKASRPLPTTRPPIHGNHSPRLNTENQNFRSFVEQDSPREFSHASRNIGNIFKSDDNSSEQHLFSRHSPKEEALWIWTNTINIDKFLDQVYQYYRGSGLWCIIFSRVLHMCETMFMAIAATFLSQCLDYTKLHTSHTLSQLVIHNCTTQMSLSWSIGVWVYIFYVIWKCVQLTLDFKRLLKMRSFFTYLLGIPEQDMQTISWQDIVARIMAVRDANPQTAINLTPKVQRFIGSQSKKRLDAHDIANRLMRKDNYLIAMINKDIMDFGIPIPFLKGHTFFSPTLEWLIQFSILDFVFNSDGQVQQEFLKSSHRRVLSGKLKQRFIFAGLLNLVCAPFVMTYMIIRWVFEYYQEYQKNPTLLGTRRYTPLAEWKFREFNELDHLFQERIKMSYTSAHLYVTQFPKQLTEQIARTILFVTGALVAILAALTIHDAEFLNFEITPGHTALFYLTLLGGIWAAARGSVSEETTVFNPEYVLNNVVKYTRYFPEHWNGRLHGNDVLREFSSLYKLKWVILLEELLGAITAPCVMLFSLPQCSDQIIDFFREFTVHIDGLGYVCAFAVFDFKNGVINLDKQQSSRDIRHDYYSTKHGKMAASFYGFMDNYVGNTKISTIISLDKSIRGSPVINNFQSHQFVPPSLLPFSSINHVEAASPMPRNGIGSVGNEDTGNMYSGRNISPHHMSIPPPRHDASLASPISTDLLDPHNQPSVSVRSIYRKRLLRPLSSHRNYIEPNSLLRPRIDIGKASPGYYNSASETGGFLGESIWQTSPTSSLNLGDYDSSERDTGVLGLIYELQRTRRPRGGLY